MSSASGVKILDSVIEDYQKLQKDQTLKYIIFSIKAHNGKDYSAIDVHCKSEEKKRNKEEDISEQETLFEEFTEHLRKAEKANECRYGLFDFCCRDSAGHPRQGIVFIAWSPENAKTKEKMVYASSRDALQKKFDGVKVIIQATDYDEIDKDVVEKELVRKLYS